LQLNISCYLIHYVYDSSGVGWLNVDYGYKYVMPPGLFRNANKGISPRLLDNENDAIDP